ncbi:membrane-associated tyrosine- and threonine-specific cdc2-inhibitory kinase [Zeugodacus cucurbitae]|uniref:Membrane-associated tyrosine- and threonine-specific cdc2-inhibitory kinase n=1 Tax=Zeugodacus cucurbitae TaxID=28588 RepID=A0A0A1WG97_ZEUCU|nr:membrane-associated tyrosine- and threonine-specific cdc2-inhibitory kinase [Zeugodacus cucurbitae]XP_011184377.1 membrane-associated tyrosine- and threonine-specific cdc2-inhibitory kinase [Zeugodacus cucurbitae]
MTTESALPLPRLPVPDIRAEVAFQHSQKQNQRLQEYRLRPPKLRLANRSHLSACMSTTAHAISFRGESDGNSNALPELDPNALSGSYDRSMNETYFEQCFTRLAKIGEGSFGEVFKVRSNEDGRMYAIKMSKELYRSENYRQERLEEVRRYEQFSGHANFVQFYRAWEQNDRLYMQMELCRESLDRYLVRRQHIPEDTIWNILLDLLLALKNLHDRNLIHLDIKLDNVLIGDDDSCKLADFGLVIDVDRANRHQATEGDSRYMAPEILQGKFSKAADIFSLGVAMLELSCYLDLPHNGPLWQQLRSGVLPQDFMKNISPELEGLIRQMMSPDPDSRPTVDQLLSHKKLVSLMECRNRWKLIIKMKQTIRRSRRVAWSKLCNLKQIIFNFVASVLTAYMHRDTISNEHKPNGSPLQQHLRDKRPPMISMRLHASTPTAGNVRNTPIEFLPGENCLNLSQQSTPITFATHNKIVNSTPVNHNNHSFRSRKDLTKTSFKAVENDCGIENFNDIQSSPTAISRPNSFLNLEDLEQNSQAFVSLDKSSLQECRKKLFSKMDN